MSLSRRGFLINSLTIAVGGMVLPKVAKIIEASPSDLKKLNLNDELSVIAKGQPRNKVFVVGNDQSGYIVNASVFFNTSTEAFAMAKFLAPLDTKRWYDEQDMLTEGREHRRMVFTDLIGRTSEY